MATYKKISPISAHASSSYSTYTADKLIDGTASAWLSSAGANTQIQWACIRVAASEVVNRVVIRFSEYWSKDLVIGYSYAVPVSQNSVNRLRTIDFNVTTKDDLGVTIAIGVDLTFILPAFPASGYISAFPLTAGVNGGGASPYIGIAEMTAYSEVNDIIGTTPRVTDYTFGASSALAGAGYQPSNAFDDSMTTRWLSVLGSQAAQFIWMKPNVDLTSGFLRVRFDQVYGWGDYINIGYIPAGASAAIANAVTLRTINTIPSGTPVKDDNGTVIAPDVDLVFALNGFPAGSTIIMWPGNGRTSTSQLFVTTSAYVALLNFEFYGNYKFQGFDDVLNPKPASFVPNPFTAAPPANWTRKDYVTPGDYTYTPSDSLVTMVCFVVQGAGSGGSADYNLDGTPTTITSAIYGDDSLLLDENGNILYTGGGGRQYNVRAAINSLTDVSCDWVYAIDYTGTAGSISPITSNTALAGIPTGRFGSKAGDAYTLAQFTAGGVAGEDTNFRTAAGGLVVAASSSFVRNTSYGWVNTNGSNNSTGYVYFQPRYFAVGQTLTFTYFTACESADRLSITINGQQIHNLGGNQTSGDVSYVIPVSGEYTIRFFYTMDSSVITAPNVASIGRFRVTSTAYTPTRSGASGSCGVAYMKPTTYKLRVGAGGKGVSGGQTVPASALGTLGAGGAGGANGADGIIAVYEFRGSLFNAAAPLPATIDPYNVATKEMAGVYRTDYFNPVQNALQTYTHKLRPRTKSVIALIVGAGGTSYWNGSQQQQPVPDPLGDAFVDTGLKRYSASSGACSYCMYTNSSSNSFIYGLGGVVSEDTAVVINGERGRAGASSSNVPASTGVYNNYGNGSQPSYNSTYNFQRPGGGAGAVSLAVIDINLVANRTLNIQVPGFANVHSTGQPGIVVIFESESIFPLQVSQVTELVLRKDTTPKTWVSGESELILRKDTTPKTWVSGEARLLLRKDTDPGVNVSTDAELILRKETEVNDLQVTHMNLAIVYDADDPYTTVSGDAELLLTKNGVVGSSVSTDAELMLRKETYGATRVSWCMENILMRSPLLPTRISNTPRLMLVAEIASVFFLRFGTLEYPIKNQMYRSLTARATTVPEGAYIQLEGIFAPGTALYINGVKVGLSAPIKNNDQVYIIGGVQNYFQTFINTYTYYTTNGEVTREICGSWQIIQPDLQAAIGREYATAANLTWLKTIHTVATSQLVPQRAIANSVYQRFIEMLVSQIQTKSSQLAPAVTKALAQLIELGVLVAKTNPKLVSLTSDVQKDNPQLHDLVPVFTKMNNVTNGIAVDWERVQDHEVYVSIDWNKTAANVLFVPVNWDRQIALHKSDAQLGILIGKSKQQTTSQEVIFAKAAQNDQPARTVINASAYFGEVLAGTEMASGYHTYTLVTPEKDSGNSVTDPDSDPVVSEIGSPGAEIIELEILKDDGYASVAGLEIIKRVEDATEVLQEYEYLEKDHSISSTANYSPISYSHYARYFSVGSIAVSAYSVLLDVVPESVVSGGEFTSVNATKIGSDGTHKIATTYHDQKAKYGDVEGMKPIKGDGHNEYYSAIGEVVRYAMGFIFNATPIKAIANYGSFTAESERTSVNAAAVLANNYIVTKQYVNMHTLTPYRVAEAVNGVGKASLYMGFDTRQAALDYTSSYSDVTIKTQFNGFAYNVAVDKSFVCEIYFNGPVGWLLQGG